eukprot:scaffold294958_cov30-Tisochrysis_lutea.AAC.2
MELSPPIRWTRAPLRAPFKRSQHKMDRSREAVNTLSSESEMAIDVTAIVCSLRWRIIWRVRISHTRTSPSSPPVATNLELCEMASAQTPPR